MRVLITGGAGFIGSHIVDECICDGHHVIVVDNLSTGKKEQVHSDASFYNLNIQHDNLEAVFQKEKPEIVIHQAAQIHVNTSINHPDVDASMNIVGTIQLLEACKNHGVKKIIYASTAAVYGDPEYLPIDEKHPVQPLSGYGCSKYSAEKYIGMYSRLYGLQYTILRYANVYGERQDPRGEGGVISIFLNQALQKEPLTILGDGEQTRDYVYVKDVARANMKAMYCGEGQILNIGTGIYTSLNQVAEHLDQISQQKNRIDYRLERLGDIKHSYFDHRKAEEILSWQPQISFVTGLSHTYAYYR